MPGIQRVLLLFGAFLIVLAIIFELGSMAFLGDIGRSADVSAPADTPRPGIGIPYLAALDLLLLYTILLLVLDLFPVLRALIARVQGIATLFLCLLGLLAIIFMIFAAFSLLMLMVTLLVAVPFGTITYVVIWGQFNVSDAAVLLSFVMALKLGGVLLLFLSRPLFLKNVGFLLLIATSIGCTLLLSILHAWFPAFLVSITDALGALVIGILTAIWLIVFLIGSLPAIVNALRSLVPTPP